MMFILKRFLMVLALIAGASVGAFAQSDQDPKKPPPKEPRPPVIRPGEKPPPTPPPRDERKPNKPEYYSVVVRKGSLEAE